MLTSILSSILLYALDNTIVADLIPVRCLFVLNSRDVAWWLILERQAIVSDFDSSSQIGWLSVG